MPLAKESLEMSDLYWRKLETGNQKLDLDKSSVDPDKVATALDKWLYQNK